jgi:hypothetical protein
VPANKLRIALTSAESTFMIDRGRSAGVFVGSPVLTAEGLLGVVWEVDENSAQAIDWTHTDFRVSAMTADGVAYGIDRAASRRESRGGLLALTGTAVPGRCPARPAHRELGTRWRIPARRLHRHGDRHRGGGHGLAEELSGAAGRAARSAAQVLVGVRQGVADLSDVFNVSAPPDSMRAAVTDGGLELMASKSASFWTFIVIGPAAPDLRLALGSRWCPT